MRRTYIVGAMIGLAASACAGSPAPGAAGYPYNVQGEYEGRLLIAERPFEARLRLRTDPDGRVSGSLRVVSPVEIYGAVRGRLIDDLLRITVTYPGSRGCDGRVEGILDVERGGATIAGPVTISDCGEPVSAMLSLRWTAGAGAGIGR